jgi:hypothetical protein
LGAAAGPNVAGYSELCSASVTPFFVLIIVAIFVATTM